MQGQDVQDAVRTVLDEVLEGPRDPRRTWVVSNRPGAGVMGTLGTLSAAAAQRPGPGGTSAASHAAHLRFSLSLANRALRGDDAYAGADWASSWRIGALDDAAWRALLDDLAAQCRALQEALATPLDWSDGDLLTALCALVGHSAYHLGAIRQLAMVAQT